MEFRDVVEALDPRDFDSVEDGAVDGAVDGTTSSGQGEGASLQLVTEENDEDEPDGVGRYGADGGMDTAEEAEEGVLLSLVVVVVVRFRFRFTDGCCCGLSSSC